MTPATTHSLLLRRINHHRERPRPLPIQPHVLRETLRQNRLMSLRNEMPQGEGVVVDVTGSEPLVGHVEEGEVFLLFDESGEFFPLFMGGVDTGRVVGAAGEGEAFQQSKFGGVLDIDSRMEQDN